MNSMKHDALCFCGESPCRCSQNADMDCKYSSPLPTGATKVDSARLCYIDEPWAFFTTQPLTDQWGDDWDDAPYEHNAGYPYSPTDTNPDGTPKWTIIRVAYDADMDAPCHSYINSPYSVRQINTEGIPWLATWPSARTSVIILPGCTLLDFIRSIRLAKGTVYLPEGAGALLGMDSGAE